MGAWAEKFLPSLSSAELREYESILNKETIDLYNYATGKQSLPDDLRGSKVMGMIQEFVNTSPLGKADPAAYAEVKKTMSN